MTAPESSADRMRGWARGARGTARCHTNEGDHYGAATATARSVVYDEAARLIDEHGETAAAAMMLEQATRHRVETPPLIQFDEAGLSYARSRAWQFCAQHLNPDLPTVQPSWSATGSLG